MKYPTSETTKQELSAALKTLMSQKPLEKISIREITDLCGLRRETFYYHFADIYDLVKWMFEEEAIVLLRQHEGVQLWQEGLLQLFHYIQDNRAFCLCALRSIGHSHLRKFFQADIYGIVQRTVEQLSREMGCPADELVTQFYVIALVGTVESWLLGELDRTPEELIACGCYVEGSYSRRSPSNTGEICSAVKTRRACSELAALWLGRLFP